MAVSVAGVSVADESGRMAGSVSAAQSIWVGRCRAARLAPPSRHADDGSGLSALTRRP